VDLRRSTHQRNLFKVEKWCMHGQRVNEMLFWKQPKPVHAEDATPYEPKAASNYLDKSLAATSGALGGSFELAALPIELRSPPS
jgi:hypothetical protein